MIKGNGIDLNTSASVDVIKASQSAIVEIMTVRADQETIRAALECLKGSCYSGSAIITHCVVNGVGGNGIDDSKPPTEDEEESQ